MGSLGLSQAPLGLFTTGQAWQHLVNPITGIFLYSKGELVDQTV